MNILSRLQGSLRSTRFLAGVRVAIFALGLAGALTACGGTTKCIDDCGGAGGTGGVGGSTSCTSTKGTLSGTAYLDSAKTMPAANATVTFVLSPNDPNPTVLQGMTDAEGKFSVELDPGTYGVSGQESSGCIPTMPVTVDLKACATETVDLVFDTCPG